MKHKIKVILSGLLISMGFYGNVVADEIGDLTLKEAVDEIAFLTGNIFGPTGFLGLGVKITRELEFTGKNYLRSELDSLMRVRMPIYYRSKNCVLYGDYFVSTSQGEIDELEEGDGYGVREIFLTFSSRTLRIQLRDVYSDPSRLYIECYYNAGITADDYPF